MLSIRTETDISDAGALAFDAVPKRLGVIGAGVIGLLVGLNGRVRLDVDRVGADQAEQHHHRDQHAPVDLDDAGVGHDVVINATSASLAGAGSPVPAEALRSGCLVLDMMYGPAARPFLAWAREHGALTRDGLGMLVEQAAEAFALWRGVRPSTAPVMAAIRAELAATA